MKFKKYLLTIAMGTTLAFAGCDSSNNARDIPVKENF